MLCPLSQRNEIIRRNKSQQRGIYVVDGDSQHTHAKIFFLVSFSLIIDALGPEWRWQSLPLGPLPDCFSPSPRCDLMECCALGIDGRSSSEESCLPWDKNLQSTFKAHQTTPRFSGFKWRFLPRLWTLLGLSVQRPFTGYQRKQRWHFPSSKTELENVPGRSVPWGTGFHLRLLRCLTRNPNTPLSMTPSDHGQICLKIHHGNRVFLCGELYSKKKNTFYQNMSSID